VKENLTQLNLIRIGTSGTIQSEIGIDSLIVNTKAIGFDSLGNFYDTHQNRNCIDKTNAFLYKLSTLIETQAVPYLCNASEQLLSKVPTTFLRGMTATMPGFYAAQGRSLRAKSKLERNPVGFLAGLEYEQEKITNFEMETAGIYLLASVLGHNAISFSALLANRVTDEFSSQAEETVDLLIREVLKIYLS
jgi:uridine phosphorylase